MESATKCEIWNSNLDMDINFAAAIHLINMGKYETAVEHLEKAIAAEEGNGDMESAIMCTCVLGELLANMGERDRASEEFTKVIEYCKRTNSLGKQREVAQSFLKEFEAADRQSRYSAAFTDGYADPHGLGSKSNTTQTSVFLQ